MDTGLIYGINGDWYVLYWSGRPTQTGCFLHAIAASEWNDMAWKGTPAADRFNELW